MVGIQGRGCWEGRGRQAVAPGGELGYRWPLEPVAEGGDGLGPRGSFCPGGCGRVLWRPPGHPGLCFLIWTVGAMILPSLESCH